MVIEIKWKKKEDLKKYFLGFFFYYCFCNSFTDAVADVHRGISARKHSTGIAGFVFLLVELLD